MQAHTVQKRLESLPSLSRAGKRVNGLARLLASRTLMDASVNQTRSNLGAATPGVDGETLDGLTIERINGWVRVMSEGSYRAKPVKRVFIPKANGKLRPLGIPTYADRMVQNAQREILQRIYEPVFSTHSYGFRPGRSCHSALHQVQRYWSATKWFVEVDIKGFFDNIDHDVLLNLLRQKIDDETFVATIRAQLQAGAMEHLTGEARTNRSGASRWKYRHSYSGTPQGGIVSPILANIYLHELDRFMEVETEAFNRGNGRADNPPHKRIMDRLRNRRKKVRALGNDDKESPKRQHLIAEIKELTRTMRTLPSGDPMDPGYRRLNYARYADDFLIGVIGSKADAAAVLARIRAFLKDTLHLDVSEEKTGIVKATAGARFLGYDVRTKTGVRITRERRADFVTTRRTAAERVVLTIPTEKLISFCNKHGYGAYCEGKGTHRSFMAHSTDYEIVNIYNAELRGLANYYRLDARVKSRISKLARVANLSLYKTLAMKHKDSTSNMRRRLRKPDGRYVVRHMGRNGKVLEIATWFPSDIRDVGKPSIHQNVDRAPLGALAALSRTDVTDRLLAGKCENEYCTSPKGTPIQVHHVRAIADVGQAVGLSWLASARQRKTRYLCTECHPMVRTGARQRQVKYTDGEPDAGKLARPVRGGGA